MKMLKSKWLWVLKQKQRYAKIRGFVKSKRARRRLRNASRRQRSGGCKGVKEKGLSKGKTLRGQRPLVVFLFE